MKNSIKALVVIAVAFFASCSSTQSLQEYYVDSAENSNFMSVDVPASILNLADENLTEGQKEALSSLKKLNVLAFKLTSENEPEYKIEKAKVKAILKNDKFVELMKLNSSYGKGVIKYLGDEDEIDEVIIYGNSDDKGFAVVRVLGKNMNPAHIVQLIQALQKSDYKGEGLGEIGAFLKG